jgi:hypothetical protein
MRRGGVRVMQWFADVFAYGTRYNYSALRLNWRMVMASADVERIAEEIKSLSAAERDQLLSLVQANDAKRPMTEDEFEKMLFARGIIRSRPTRLPRPPWKPIVISGPPLSQTIIEDRR